jgi:exonuclease SbcC
MKPLVLTFQAFGSYPGQETVDFTVLEPRGLFVVTGPTGTGKTTVFDALTFALYGRLPGGRDGEPRSHHADPAVDTFVELTFEVDGVRHHIRRTPAQERPKKRGTGVTVEATTAVLSRLDETGTHPLSARATECTDLCVELVGLDAEQFQRVVLLPQGKFAQFLLARSSEREELLSHLFGGQLFDDATAVLKDRQLALGRQVEQITIEMDHHVVSAREAVASVHEHWGHGELTDDLEPGALRSLIDTLDTTGRHEADILERQRREVETLAEQAGELERLVLRWDEWTQAVDRRNVLEEQRSAMEASQQTVEQSRRARPVVEAQDRVAEALRAAQHATSRLEQHRQTLDLVLTPLGHRVHEQAPGALTTLIADMGQSLRHQRLQWDAYLRACGELATAESRVTALEAEVATESDQVAQLSQLIDEIDGRQDARLTLIAGLGALAELVQQLHQHLEARTELDALDERRTALQFTADNARDRYLVCMERFIATQAPRLAHALSDGDPCPVCGSRSHPAPAVGDGGDTVDHDAVDAARQHRDTAEQRLAELENRRAGVIGTLGAHATTSRTELERQRDERVAQLHEAQAAQRDQNVDDEQRVALIASRDEVHLRVRTMEHDVAGARTLMEERRGVTREKADLIRSVDVDRLDHDLELVDKATDLLQDLEVFTTEVTKAKAQLEALERTCRDVLASSGFESVDEAQALVRAPSAEQDLTTAYARWADDVTRTTERCRVAEEQGIPPERPDPTDVTDRLRRERDDLAERDRRHTRCSAEVDRARQALDTADAIGRGSVEVREAFDRARRVFRTCNGETASRVRLRTWVLAGELERVTDAANHHLARMTGHRYRLQRTELAKGGGRTGLDLVVHDAHTGRTRPTSSLSGGEQFQASLALALGLADVVSHGGVSSGKRFEALFVDEGFGSLDPDALDDAIAALMQLQASGRMVGAITHVEAMKQQLHVGIDVRRLPSGRGSTLVVRP